MWFAKFASLHTVISHHIYQYTALEQVYKRKMSNMEELH